MNTNRIQISEHFSLHEFQCRHCGQVKLHPSLLAKLQTLRHQLGTPLVITSGYRCEAHNRTVGGATSSYHVQGMAADIAAGPTNLSVQSLADYCQQMGFGGVGGYGQQGFVHVDVRPGTGPVRFR